MIAPNEVHIWPVEMGLITDAGDELDAREKARAERFRFDHHRRRYVAGHAAFRRILAQYIGVPAAQLSFAYGEHGKPYLPGSRLQFNMSDSGELALVGVTLDAEIGVDIERIRPFDSAVALAERFLPEADAIEVRKNPASFFRFWTRHEAWLKCTGVGLRGIRTSLPDGHFVADLDVMPGYAAAAVWRGGERRVVIVDRERLQTIR
jgi:4'-phosphopantetheinyl transferase